MPDATAIARVEETKLTRIGGREVSIVGWSFAAVRDHLETHLIEDQVNDRWCSVECMARTMFQRNSEHNRKRVRARIRGLFRALLSKDLFLVVAYDDSPSGRGRILCCKLLADQGEAPEIQMANVQIERMHARREVSEQIFQRALSVISKREAVPVP